MLLDTVYAKINGTSGFQLFRRHLLKFIRRIVIDVLTGQ